ncbi:MAG TPA: hypothetical protein VKF36_01360 [Syntrophorhabdales bacterium]|nr:hypothetical protein [Syntrophorhabdales bacterium]
MATITDFESWLDHIRPKSTVDVYSLYRAIVDQENLGRFHCLKDDAQLFLRTDKADDVLMLTSDEAVKEFLSTLRERFNIEGDIRGWYITRRAMERYREKEGTHALDGPDQLW